MSHRWVWACGVGNLRFTRDRWMCMDCHLLSEHPQKGWTGGIDDTYRCGEPKHAVDPGVFVTTMFATPPSPWTRERPTEPGEKA